MKWLPEFIDELPFFFLTIGLNTALVLLLEIYLIYAVIRMWYRQILPEIEMRWVLILSLSALLAAGLSTGIWQLGVELLAISSPVIVLSIFLGGRFAQNVTPGARVSVIVIPAFVIALPYGLSENQYGGRQSKWLNYAFAGHAPVDARQVSFNEKGGYLHQGINGDGLFRTQHSMDFRFQVAEQDLRRSARRAGFSAFQPKSEPNRICFSRDMEKRDEYCRINYHLNTREALVWLCINAYSNESRDRRNAQNLASICAASHAVGHDFIGEDDDCLAWTVQKIVKGATVEDPRSPFHGTYFGAPGLRTVEQEQAMKHLAIRNGMLIYAPAN